MRIVLFTRRRHRRSRCYSRRGCSRLAGRQAGTLFSLDPSIRYRDCTGLLTVHEGAEGGPLPKDERWAPRTGRPSHGLRTLSPLNEVLLLLLLLFLSSPPLHPPANNRVEALRAPYFRRDQCATTAAASQLGLGNRPCRRNTTAAG